MKNIQSHQALPALNYQYGASQANHESSHRHLPQLQKLEAGPLHASPSEAAIRHNPVTKPTAPSGEPSWARKDSNDHTHKRVTEPIGPPSLGMGGDQFVKETLMNTRNTYELMNSTD